MSEGPNKLSHFWQELKRRRVLHVITVYASAAFDILKDDDRYWDLYERTGHKAYDDYMATQSQ